MGKRYSREDKKLLDALEQELQGVLSQAKGPVERTVKLTGSVRKQLWHEAERRRVPLARVIAERKQTFLNAVVQMASDPLGPEGHHLMAVSATKPDLNS